MEVKMRRFWSVLVAIENEGVTTAVGKGGVYGSQMRQIAR